MKPIFQKLFTYFLLPVVCCLFVLSCSVNKAKIDNSLKKYFDEKNVEGCFAMFNNANGEVTVYNMDLDTQRFSPAATFQVVNSLIGLETGAITNDTMTIKWTGIRTDTAKTADMDMRWAFQNNADAYTQEIARRIGRDTMQAWIDSLGYGNKNISGPIDSFWLNGTLTISPDEQLGLMKRLYFDQLPFRKSSQQMIKDAMKKEDNTAYRWSYCNVAGYEKNGHGIGWVTGWIEENKHVYFFVTFIRSDDASKTAAILPITKSILKQLGFFEGRK